MEHRAKMKNININELQAKISKIMKDVEKGEVYEVMRYSRPVAVIFPKSQYKENSKKCEQCIADFRRIAYFIKEKIQ